MLFPVPASTCCPLVATNTRCLPVPSACCCLLPTGAYCPIGIWSPVVNSTHCPPMPGASQCQAVSSTCQCLQVHTSAQRCTVSIAYCWPQCLVAASSSAHWCIPPSTHLCLLVCAICLFPVVPSAHGLLVAVGAQCSLMPVPAAVNHPMSASACCHPVPGGALRCLVPATCCCLLSTGVRQCLPVPIGADLYILDILFLQQRIRSTNFHM